MEAQALYAYSRTHFHPQVQHGLTLIELMVTLSITAILAVTSFGSFASIIERKKAESLVNELYHILQFARIEALTQKKFTTICPSIDHQSCIRTRDWSNKNILVFVDENYNHTLDGDEYVIKDFTTGEDNSKLLWRAFQNKSYLSYRPNGMTDYQNGNLTYCPPSGKVEDAKVLVINLPGRPYLGKDNDGDGIVENGSGHNVSCSL